MQEKVKELADWFVAGRPRLMTPQGAFNRCRQVSKSFMTLLAEHGIDAKVVRLSESNRDFPDAHSKWRKLGPPKYWVHYAVLAEGIVVDCTMRQFDPKAGVPIFQTPEQVLQDWDDAVVYEDVTTQKVVGHLSRFMISTPSPMR